MQTETSCEICGRNDWQVLGQRTYTDSQQKNDSLYQQLRFRVLFDRWFPGQTQVTLKSKLCKNCGFIIYMPRPEAKDIDAKYRYLQELKQANQDYRQVTGLLAHDSPLEMVRSRSLFRYINQYGDLKRVTRILDYGGADGRLMVAFRDSGKQCYLVDYGEDCIPGVTRLADTIEEIDTEEKFDLIVCSHVIEHIAQPLQTLRRLAAHLNPAGQIFIEVPMEVWKQAPLYPEPVTHINFFTPSSLHNLLLISGLDVRRCELVACTYQGKERHGVRAICQKRRHPVSPDDLKLRNPDGMNFLNPNLFHTLRYHACLPQRLPKVLLSKFK